MITHPYWYITMLSCKSPASSPGSNSDAQVCGTTQASGQLWSLAEIAENQNFVGNFDQT
jgi:hypothetical protein